MNGGGHSCPPPRSPWLVVEVFLVIVGFVDAQTQVLRIVRADVHLVVAVVEAVIAVTSLRNAVLAGLLDPRGSSSCTSLTLRQRNRVLCPAADDALGRVRVSCRGQLLRQHVQQIAGDGVGLLRDGRLQQHELRQPADVQKRLVVRVDARARAAVDAVELLLGRRVGERRTEHEAGVLERRPATDDPLEDRLLAAGVGRVVHLAKHALGSRLRRPFAIVPPLGRMDVGQVSHDRLLAGVTSVCVLRHHRHIRGGRNRRTERDTEPIADGPDPALVSQHFVEVGLHGLVTVVLAVVAADDLSTAGLVAPVGLDQLVLDERRRAQQRVEVVHHRVEDRRPAQGVEEAGADTHGAGHDRLAHERAVHQDLGGGHAVGSQHQALAASHDHLEVGGVRVVHRVAQVPDVLGAERVHRELLAGVTGVLHSSVANQFGDAVVATGGGVLRDRVRALGDRVDAAVLALLGAVLLHALGSVAEQLAAGLDHLVAHLGLLAGVTGVLDRRHDRHIRRDRRLLGGGGAVLAYDDSGLADGAELREGLLGEFHGRFSCRQAACVASIDTASIDQSKHVREVYAPDRTGGIRVS